LGGDDEGVAEMLNGFLIALTIDDIRGSVSLVRFVFELAQEKKRTISTFFNGDYLVCNGE
jgi:hypothetical protein